MKGRAIEHSRTGKSPKRKNKAQRKFDYKNYDAITMRGNYEWKLLQEIMSGNYHRKLSASIYHHAKNVGIIGILPYPKIRWKNIHYMPK